MDSKEAYLAAVRAVLATEDGFRALERWLKDECDECGYRLMESDADHTLVNGYVAIGCMGYLQINPNAVGIDMPEWIDWRDSDDEIEE